MALPAGPSITFKERHCGLFVFAFLNQNINFITTLIDSTSKIMHDTIYLYKYLIQVPHITELTALLPDLTTILIAELYVSISNGLITYADTSGGQ
jgi:hypothetical protein